MKQQGVKDKDVLSKAGRRGHGEAGKVFDEAWPRDQSTKGEEEPKTETKTAAKTQKKKKRTEGEKEDRVGASEQGQEEQREGVETKAPIDGTPQVLGRKRGKTADTSGDKAEPFDAD